MNSDHLYMQRCLELAKNGLGTTYPNPLVGCVIVYKNKIIGEGWHHKAGKAHAEVNAINSVKDKSQLRKATLYVNLEPCSHYGKTPPCSDLIIEKGLKKVVIGSTDPNPKVAGKGIAKMMRAGLQVIVGCLEEESRWLNRRFFTFQEKKRPYIILKWAQTEDGFIAPKNQIPGKPVWITNPYSKQLVHKWRSEEQGILVGRNTAIKDNPQLNVRLWKKQHPTRILIDPQLKSLSSERSLHLFDQSIDSLIFCKTPQENQKNIRFIPIDFTRESLPQIMEALYRENLQSLIVEGGRQTLQNFLDAKLWDEARVFIGDAHWGAGIKAPVLSKEPKQVRYIAEDQLKTYHHD